MLNLDQAISLVRQELDGWLIKTVYDFDDKFFFVVSPGNEFSIDDLASITAIVDKKTSSVETKSPSEMIYTYVMKLDPDSQEGYLKAVESSKPVDLTKEQFEEFMKQIR